MANDASTSATLNSRFVFEGSELRIDDLVFRLGNDFEFDAWKSSPADCFLMFKSRPLLELFHRFFGSKSDFLPRNILEIGIWDGGSTAYWFEYFQPEKLVAVDGLKRQDSAYFRRYVESRDIADRVKTYWDVDQADAPTLLEIVQNEFEGRLDLVIDDGSHLPGPTKKSVETLYPLLRPGGLYVIEDWNWELLPHFRSPDHPWATTEGLIGLVIDLIRLTGGSHLIPAVAVYPNFVSIERGVGLEGQSFELDEHLSALPQMPIDARH